MNICIRQCSGPNIRSYYNVDVLKSDLRFYGTTFHFKLSHSIKTVLHLGNSIELLLSPFIGGLVVQSVQEAKNNVLPSRMSENHYRNERPHQISGSLSVLNNLRTGNSKVT